MSDHICTPQTILSCPVAQQLITAIIDRNYRYDQLNVACAHGKADKHEAYLAWKDKIEAERQLWKHVGEE